MITSIDELDAYAEGILHIWPQYREEFTSILTDAENEIERENALEDMDKELEIVTKYKRYIDEYEAP